jgi:hypothetical protein
MKKVIIIPIIFFVSTIKAQVFDSTKYYVTEAIINDEDYTDIYSKDGQYLRFYTNTDGASCFLNGTRNGKELSCGRIAEFKLEEIKEEGFLGDLITFQWYYHNSYNTDSGLALVSLKKIYREKGAQFDATIITKKLDVFNFSGHTNETITKELNKKSSSIIGYHLTKYL